MKLRDFFCVTDDKQFRSNYWLSVLESKIEFDKVKIENTKDLIEIEKIYIEIEKIAHSRWWKEDDLVNNRLTWLLQSQVIFFAIYGMIYRFSKDCNIEDAQYLLHMIPILSTCICYVILIGIFAAWEAQINLSKQYKDLRFCTGASRLTSIGGKFAGSILPFIFACGWGYLRAKDLSGTLIFVLIFTALVLTPRVFVFLFRFFCK